MSQTSIWGLQNDKNRCKFAKVGLESQGDQNFGNVDRTPYSLSPYSDYTLRNGGMESPNACQKQYLDKRVLKY
jgi:hypothetical protein